MRNYRTRTYIAGDWTGDKNLIDKLYEWNNSDYWALHFIDAHELTQSKDTSMYCTIKRSLSERLSISKTFVLIVGEKTNAFRNFDSIKKKADPSPSDSLMVMGQPST